MKKPALSTSLVSLAAVHRSVLDKQLRQIGLRRGQEALLIAIAQEDNEDGCSPIVQTLGLDHSTVVTSVSRLEKSGLITVRKSQADKRFRLLSLTPAGATKAQQAMAILTAIETAVTQGLSDADIAEFSRLAKHIQNNLNHVNL